MTDPFEWLRSVDPLPTDSEPGDPQAILQRVLAERPVGSRRHRRLVAIGATGIAVMCAAAATWITTRDTTDPSQVACYAVASLAADPLVIDRGTDPIAACATEWASVPDAAGPIPELQQCLLESGVVGVFPGPGPHVCDEMNLDRASAELTPEAEALLNVENELREQFLAHCVPLAEGAALAEVALIESGLSGWTVSQLPDRVEEPCSSLGVDVAAKTVVIAPVSPPDGGQIGEQ